jgi:GNAT superfamily N-acetyltransferase
MNTSIACRKATIEDQPAIWRVRTASIRTLCRSHYGEEQTEAWANVPPPEDFAEVICARDLLVAEVDGTIVGVGFINRQAAVLEAVFVAPEFVRRGVGTALLTSLEEIARQAGLIRLSLSASLNAVSFYRAAGYQTGEKTTWRHPAGFDLACVAMTKDLC